MITLNVVPVAKPRMTRSDRWNERPCVLKYRAYKDDLRRAAREAGYEPGNVVKVHFTLPMPRSWSRAKRAEMNGTPHLTKPDLDNLIKGFLDCLLPENDSAVWAIEATKIWGETGKIMTVLIE